MVHSVEKFLSENPNTVYSARTIARRINSQKKKVFAFLRDELKDGNPHIQQVKPSVVGSYQNSSHFYQYKL